MAAYNITKSNGNPGPTIPDSASPDVQTDIPLIGQNAISYGDDVATAFFWLLENFASDVAPATGSAGRLTGQLWYDTLNNQLKVYDGGWTALVSSGTGTSTFAGDIVPSVTATWDVGSAALRWQEVHGAQIIAGTSVAGPTITASTALVASGTTSLVGATTTTATTGTIQMGTSTWLRTAASIAGNAGFRVPHGTAPSSPVNGDIWTTTGGMFARVNGVTRQLDVASGAVVDSFIGRTGAVVAVATDYASFYPRKDSGGGAQSIDAATTWTYNNRPIFNGGTSGVDSPFTVDSTFVVTNLNADLLDGQHGTFYATDSLVVKIAGAQDITGIKTFTQSVIADVANGGANSHVANRGFKIEGTTNAQSTNEGYFSLYYQNSSQEQVRFGTGSGNSFSEVRALVGDLNLYAANTLVLNVNQTASTITSGGVTSATFRNAFLTGANATTSATVGDHNGVQRNVGYNETPIADDVGGNINTGSFNLGGLSIGKFISRTTGTSRSVTLVADADIPIGGSVLIHNGNSGGTLTIIPFAGQTLDWIDGSGSLPASATRTLAHNSICTVRKVSSTQWQIWGNGIS